MANPEHLDILRQGVQVWNRWRRKHPEIQPDLSKIDLHNAYLREVDFRGANFCESNLSGANLTIAHLDKADFHEADLSSANLMMAHLVEANFSRANLNRANILRAVLSSVDFSSADLREADISHSILDHAKLINSKLIKADLTASSLGKATCSGADFSNAKLGGAILFDAYLEEANLQEADLIFANLSGTILTKANMQGVKLFGAILHLTDLSEVDLSKAELGLTAFDEIDLSTVKGLDTVKSLMPSTIGIDTIYRSQGCIPEDFLRKAGVPESFITYMRSLIITPIDYYSCFISYSSEDQAFAERLYADLQAKGVRCWFAPENLKWGEHIRSGIDEAIHMHDKLLLILSEHSVASGWVEHEVKIAFTREKKDKRTVLFPVRVDRAVFDSPFDWATEIRHERNIGDFTRWKNHDAYQKAFERLLRDLKASS